MFSHRRISFVNLMTKLVNLMTTYDEHARREKHEALKVFFC